MIKWEETYAVGVTALDAQHQSLFQFSNDIEEALLGQEVSNDLLANYLQYLKRYIKTHFGQEETCMLKYACPIAQTNTQAHQNFIRAFQTFEGSIKQSEKSTGALKEFHKFLEDWLVSHIGSIDTKLRPCVTKGSV